MLADLVLPTAAGPEGSARLRLRRAEPGDLDALIRLLSDDPISASRGDVASAADVDAYRAGLTAILASDSNDLVLVDRGPETPVIGTMQVTVIPGMARRGSSRLLVEAVRVASTERSTGIGSAMMRWAMDEAAPTLRCSLVQLTSDAAREAAHRFYLRLGFIDSHVGFKYAVPAHPR